MRTLALTALSCVCGLAISGTTTADAADQPYTIARWGNALLVTAPASTNMDRRTSAHMLQRMTLDFEDAPLTDIIDFIRSTTHINIVVAPSVLLQSPHITLKAKDMKLGNVLHWVTKLSKTNMGYVHGALFISDQPIVEASVTRLYDVSDLTMPIKDFPGPELALKDGAQPGNGATLFGPIADDTSSAPTSDDIGDLIKKVIHPEKWE